MAEIAIKLSDDDRDGRVVTVMPDGVLIPAPTMLAWLRDAKPPTAILDAMPGWMSRRVRRAVLRLSFDLSGDTKAIAAMHRVREDDVAIVVAAAEERKAKILEDGYDTVWGHTDRRAYGLLRVDGLTKNDAMVLLEPEVTMDAAAERIAKRHVRVNYTSLVDATRVTDWRTDGKLVDADRDHATPALAVMNAVQDIARGA